jgi:ubiquinone/menaquinone biosynthesis C-methylase UbiE/choline kinase
MRAVILAAGKPATAEAKAISNLQLRGQNLLDIQVSVLREAGAETISVVVGYRADSVARADVQLIGNVAWGQSGSLMSLAFAQACFDGTQDVLVCYGDTIFSPRVVDALMRAEAGIAAVCYLDRTNRDVGRFREFAHIEAGKLVGVSSERGANDVRTVFSGLVLVRRSKAAVVQRYLEQLARSDASHVGSLLDAMIRAGVEVAPVLVERGWFELSTPALLDEALAADEFLDTVIQIHTDWAARAQRYDKLQWVNNDRLLAGMVEVAAGGRPSRVLDLGTGSGKVLLAMRDTLGGGEFWGLDLSPEMMSNIPRRDGLVLKVGNVETLEGIPAGYFDVVTARMVFHHVADLERAMASIVRVLRPGGRLVVCEGVPPTARTVRWYTDMFRYKEDRHTLTEGDLIHAFAAAGLKDIRTETIVLRNASLNNWLDNSGIPQRNIDVIKEMHFCAPAEVRRDYQMEFLDGDCLMTWRFAVVHACTPA